MKRWSLVLALAALASIVIATGSIHPSQMISRGMKYAADRFGDKTDTINKFGRNSIVATGALATVWACGPIAGSQALYPWATVATAQTVYVSSSSAADTIAFEVQGLDANWEKQTASVTLDGFTAVALPGTWLRIFRAKDIDPGQSALAGNVYIHIDSDPGADGIPDTTTDVLGCVTGSNNQSFLGFYTVPEPFTAYLTQVCFGVNKKQNAAADFKMSVRENLNPLPFQIKLVMGTDRASGPACIPYDPPLRFPPRTDIEMLVDVSANATDAFATFTLEMVDE